MDADEAGIDCGGSCDACGEDLLTVRGDQIIYQHGMDMEILDPGLDSPPVAVKWGERPDTLVIVTGEPTQADLDASKNHPFHFVRGVQEYHVFRLDRSADPSTTPRLTKLRTERPFDSLLPIVSMSMVRNWDQARQYLDAHTTCPSGACFNSGWSPASITALEGSLNAQTLGSEALDLSTLLNGTMRISTFDEYFRQNVTGSVAPGSAIWADISDFALDENEHLLLAVRVHFGSYAQRQPRIGRRVDAILPLAGQPCMTTTQEVSENSPDEVLGPTRESHLSVVDFTTGAIRWSTMPGAIALEETRSGFPCPAVTTRRFSSGGQESCGLGALGNPNLFNNPTGTIFDVFGLRASGVSQMRRSAFRDNLPFITEPLLEINSVVPSSQVNLSSVGDTLIRCNPFTYVHSNLRFTYRLLHARILSTAPSLWVFLVVEREHDGSSNSAFPGFNHQIGAFVVDESGALIATLEPFTESPGGVIIDFLSQISNDGTRIDFLSGDREHVRWTKASAAQRALGEFEVHTTPLPQADPGPVQVVQVQSGEFLASPIGSSSGPQLEYAIPENVFVERSKGVPPRIPSSSSSAPVSTMRELKISLAKFTQYLIDNNLRLNSPAGTINNFLGFGLGCCGQAEQLRFLAPSFGISGWTLHQVATEKCVTQWKFGAAFRTEIQHSWVIAIRNDGLEAAELDPWTGWRGAVRPMNVADARAFVAAHPYNPDLCWNLDKVTLACTP